uniref:Uncharacterized protein n=1 Tax=Steinernema glaseri TaxID=37863 RepID=A0A1I7ZWX7_9BILA
MSSDTYLWRSRATRTVGVKCFGGAKNSRESLGLGIRSSNLKVCRFCTGDGQLNELTMVLFLGIWILKASFGKSRLCRLFQADQKHSHQGFLTSTSFLDERAYLVAVSIEERVVGEDDVAELERHVDRRGNSDKCFVFGGAETPELANPAGGPDSPPDWPPKGFRWTGTLAQCRLIRCEADHLGREIRSSSNRREQMGVAPSPRDPLELADPKILEKTCS